jgi:TolB protein
MIVRPGTLLCLIALWMGALGSSAQAAFPGQNGKIAFSTGHGIDVIDSDGAGRTSFAPGVSDAAWSADGSKLVFLGVDEGQRVQVFSANADGSNRIQLTTAQFQGFQTPAWSPDGRVVFNWGECFYNFCVQGLAVMNADGSERRDIGLGGSTPNWSPAGTKIAATGRGTVCTRPDPNDPYDYVICNAQVFTINPEGTGQTRITDDTTSDYDPNWSPDGGKIVFVSFRDGNSEIYSMNADGTGQQRLTSDPGLDAWPAWSPDGTKIVFVSDRNEPHPAGCGESCNYEIYVMNADGTGQTRLTNSPLREFGPDWQPLPGPQRADYKNAAQFCKALRDFLGDEGFRNRYGGANAHGKCVSGGGR